MARMDGLIEIFLQPGDLFVATPGYQIRTILGSCVSVCLFDPVSGIGGMNHYVYPPRGGASPSRFSQTTLSGDICMEGLLAAMLQAGARREWLRAKAFGGGRMFEHEDVLSVGKRNSSFAKYWLEQEGIVLELADFHGAYARKLMFHPASGQHVCQRIPTPFLSNDPAAIAMHSK